MSEGRVEWSEFAQRLTRELIQLPVEAFVIVQAPGGLPYVQAMRSAEGMSAEVVGNEFLPDGLKLGPQQEERLAAFGWHAPGQDGRVNWWRQLPLPDLAPENALECGHLAARMAAALGEVFAIRAPLDLEYRAARNGPGGGPLPLPGLGLAPVGMRPTLTWESFAERLAGELARLDQGMVLVVHQKTQGSHYVQVLRDSGGSVRAEAVSGQVLPAELRFAPGTEGPLAAAGWYPPVPDGNWTSSLPPEATPDDHRGLAGLMVVALRDVQGATWPSHLEYEAFHRGVAGLIELLDLGIATTADPAQVVERRAGRPLPQALSPTRPPVPVSVPAPVTPPAVPVTVPVVSGPPAAASMPADTPAVPVPPAMAPEPVPDPAFTPPPPAPPAPAPSVPLHAPAPAPPRPVAVPGRTPAEAELEARLAEARARGDHREYARLLQGTELFLPARAEDDDRRFATAAFNDGTYILAFTSAAAMAEALRGQAAGHRRIAMTELARAWPKPEWMLAVNVTLPSAAYIDAQTIGRMAPGLLVLQKTVPHPHVAHYLDSSYDRVAGLVHRASDVADLDTPATLVQALGLAYADSPFSTADESVHVICWPVHKEALLVPTGEGPPQAFRIDSQRLPHGAEMYLVTASGKRSRVAAYDADLVRWIG
ncbi:MAG: hypothetical protein JWN00_3578 [Actinomycetia bacterium]|nr:hypothetical protein [Actinomycetes bacterium]